MLVVIVFFNARKSQLVASKIENQLTVGGWQFLPLEQLVSKSILMLLMS